MRKPCRDLVQTYNKPRALFKVFTGYLFDVVKHKLVRCKGLVENDAQIKVLLPLRNLYMPKGERYLRKKKWRERR